MCVCVCMCVCVFMLWKTDLKLMTMALDGNFSMTFLLVTQRRWGPVNLDDILPGHPGFRPSSHSAVQLESLALPDCLSTGLDDKLWRVCQAVWVHLLTELCPLVHL